MMQYCAAVEHLHAQVAPNMPIEAFVAAVNPTALGFQSRNQLYKPVEFSVQLAGSLKSAAGAIRVQVPVHANPDWLPVMKHRFAAMIGQPALPLSQLDFRTIDGRSVSSVPVDQLHQVGKLHVFVNGKELRLPQVPAIPIEYSVTKMRDIDRWITDTVEDKLPALVARYLAPCQNAEQLDAAIRGDGPLVKAMESAIQGSDHAAWAEFVRTRHVNSPIVMPAAEATKAAQSIARNVLLGQVRRMVEAAAPQIKKHFAQLESARLAKQMTGQHNPEHYAPILGAMDASAGAGAGGENVIDNVGEFYRDLTEDILTAPHVREAIAAAIYSRPMMSIGCRWKPAEEPQLQGQGGGGQGFGGGGGGDDEQARRRAEAERAEQARRRAEAERAEQARRQAEAERAEQARRRQTDAEIEAERRRLEEEEAERGRAPAYNDLEQALLAARTQTDVVNALRTLPLGNPAGQYVLNATDRQTYDRLVAAIPTLKKENKDLADSPLRDIAELYEDAVKTAVPIKTREGLLGLFGGGLVWSYADVYIEAIALRNRWLQQQVRNAQEAQRRAAEEAARAAEEARLEAERTAAAARQAGADQASRDAAARAAEALRAAEEEARQRAAEEARLREETRAAAEAARRAAEAEASRRAAEAEAARQAAEAEAARQAAARINVGGGQAVKDAYSLTGVQQYLQAGSIAEFWATIMQRWPNAKNPQDQINELLTIQKAAQDYKAQSTNPNKVAAETDIQLWATAANSPGAVKASAENLVRQAMVALMQVANKKASVMVDRVKARLAVAEAANSTINASIEAHHPWNAMIHHTIKPMLGGAYPAYYNAMHTKQDMTSQASYIGALNDTYRAYHLFGGAAVAPLQGLARIGHHLRVHKPCDRTEQYSREIFERNAERDARNRDEDITRDSAAYRLQVEGRGLGDELPPIMSLNRPVGTKAPPVIPIGNKAPPVLPIGNKVMSIDCPMSDEEDMGDEISDIRAQMLLGSMFNSSSDEEMDMPTPVRASISSRIVPPCPPTIAAPMAMEDEFGMPTLAQALAKKK